jgi:hypothetical protein
MLALGTKLGLLLVRLVTVEALFWFWKLLFLTFHPWVIVINPSASVNVASKTSSA